MNIEAHENLYNKDDRKIYIESICTTATLKTWGESMLEPAVHSWVRTVSIH